MKSNIIKLRSLIAASLMLAGFTTITARGASGLCVVGFFAADFGKPTPASNTGEARNLSIFLLTLCYRKTRGWLQQMWRNFEGPQKGAKRHQKQ